MKLRALTFILILNAVAIQAQESRSTLPAFSTNWGAKVGFAATASYVTNAVIEGHHLTEYSQDTQVGHFAALLFRLNSRTIFLQTGLGLSANKSSFYINLNSWDPQAESKNDMSCSYTMKSFTLPIQLGYHIVNRPPYCMSVFTGPRLRYTPDKFYSVQYNNLDPYEFTETPTEMIMGWTAGLSVRIGRTFLDFEYEASINTVSGPMTELTEANPAPNYTIDRRVGIISFSYGIMF